MREGPCATCHLSLKCRTEYKACDLFLRFVGFTDVPHRPKKIPSAAAYFRAFPGDRGRVPDNTVRSFAELINNVRECA